MAKGLNAIDAPVRDNFVPAPRAIHEFHGFTDLIVAAVAPVFSLKQTDLTSGSRGNARIALARQVAMYLARVIGGLQLTEIGRAFHRDRTTVAHACAVVEDRRDNPDFNRIVDLLERIVARLQQISCAHSPQLPTS